MGICSCRGLWQNSRQPFDSLDLIYPPITRIFGRILVIALLIASLSCLDCNKSGRYGRLVSIRKWDQGGSGPGWKVV